jgi:predicted transposase YdaD
MSVNREHKDSLFSFLFSDPEILRKLYGALEGIHLDPDVPIQINTLSDVIFLEQLNDLSFVVDNRLVVLIEHQSTINPNMALRMLMYIGRIYEKIVDRKKLYSSQPLTVPWPEFIVLYNGTAPYPDQQTLNLSDLFDKAPHLMGTAMPPALELKVKVYNINKGHNRAIVEKCKELEGYSIFIAKVREFKAGTGDNEKAMKMTIQYCIENNILKKFLDEHTPEVLNMLLTEWNTIEYGEVQREEGREEGKEEGQNIVLDLMRQGYSAEQIEAKLAAIKSDVSGAAGK